MSQTRTFARLAAPALTLGLIAALTARAGADPNPVVTVLQLPAQGVVSNSACEAVPLSGALFVVVRAFPHNPGIPGAPLPAQVGLVGALSGQGASGTRYVALAGPLEASMLFFPHNPGAPISFPIQVAAVVSLTSPPSPDFPHNPGCPTQASTGMLSLTLNADGTVQSASVSVGGLS